MQKKIKESASKVDYRLLYKKQILDYLEDLKNSEQSLGQIDEAMQKLFQISDQVIPICLSKLKENDEELAPVICYALEFANDFGVVEPLLDILIMPNVSDKIKARILTVLTHYGIDAGELPLDMIMNDFDKMASESMEEMLEDMVRDPFLIPFMLEDLCEFTTEMKLAYIMDLAALKDERAILFLEILASTDDPPIASYAIKALGQIKSGKALYVLEKLKNKVLDENKQKLVHRECQRLRFQGITAEVYEPWEKLKYPVKVFISSIDGLGSRVLWIAWKNPYRGRKMCFMNLITDVDVGIKDCWGASNVTTKEFNASLKDFSKSMFVSQCELEYAALLISDAMSLNKMKGISAPYQFYFWKNLLEKHCRIEHHLYDPEFTGYDFDQIKSDEECLKNTFNLYESSFFNDWFIAHPRVYDYAEENKSKRGYHLKKMTHQKMESLFSKFSEELIEPNLGKIKRMLQLSIDFLIKTGQEQLAKTALCAYLNLDIKPLYYHPFIQRMIIESIKVALSNMKNGFDMRQNYHDF